MAGIRIFLLGLIATALITFHSCVDPFTPSLDTREKSLIVEGQISDDPGPYEVKLSLTEPYLSQNINLPVENATVKVTDDQGNTFPFPHTNRGIYRSDSLTFRAQAGRTYTLIVQFGNDREYRSQPELLRAAPGIDTAFTRFVETTDLNGVVTYSFDVFAVTTDPAASTDFYRWDWAHYAEASYCQTTVLTVGESRVRFNYPCCGPCWDIERPRGRVDLTADTYINGNRFEKFITNIPYDSKSDYFMAIDQYNIPSSTHQFWKIVNLQVSNTGGIFDVPPATIPSNIYNVRDSSELVLGVFTVAGHKRGSFYLKRNYAPVNPYQTTETEASTGTPCVTCANNFFRTSRKPEGW